MKNKILLILSAFALTSADIYLYARGGGGGGGFHGGGYHGGGRSFGGGGHYAGGNRGFAGGGARTAPASRASMANRSSARPAAANRGARSASVNRGNRVGGNRHAGVHARNGNFNHNGRGYGRWGNYGWYGGFGWYGFWPAFGLGLFVYPWILDAFYGYGNGGDYSTTTNVITNNYGDTYTQDAEDMPEIPENAVFVSEDELAQNPKLQDYLRKRGLTSQENRKM